MASAGSLNERIFQQEKWSRAIRKHSPNLRVWLHASSDDIANIMVVREAFTESERITVLGGSSGIDKMDKIMDYVKGKDSWVSETFCAILDELGHSDSADLLRQDAGVPIPYRPPPTQRSGRDEDSDPEDTSNSRLNEKPTKRELLAKVVPKIADRWKYIGIHLGLDDDLKQIDADYQKVADKGYHVLEAWLEGKGAGSITWEALLKAMKADGYRASAKEFRRQLIRGRNLCD
jgi:hypothetical protein